MRSQPALGRVGETLKSLDAVLGIDDTLMEETSAAEEAPAATQGVKPAPASQAS